MYEFAGIDRITVRNYKSIRDVSLEIRPLTVIAGANGTGKSNMLQPLLLLKQALHDVPSSLLSDGGLTLTSFAKTRPRFCDESSVLNVSIERDGLPVATIFEKVNGEYGAHTAPFVIRDIYGIIYVPSLRGKLKSFYPYLFPHPPFYGGDFSDHVAGVIAQWEKNDNTQYHHLVKMLEDLHLTKGISAHENGSMNIIADSMLEICVCWHPDKPSASKTDMVNIADAGTGISQVLPILTALIAAEPNQIVYIEHPDVYLHPEAVVGLANVIIEAITRGVKVIVETHNGTFLTALQVAIGERRSTGIAEKVILHWFTRDEDGATKIGSGDMNGDGTYDDSECRIDFKHIDLDLCIKACNLSDMWKGEEQNKSALLTEAETLLQRYHAEYQLHVTAHPLGNLWVAIKTPYLDHHNDRLEVFLCKEGDGYLLTDHGNTLCDVLDSGFSVDDKKLELLDVILNGFGVRLVNKGDQRNLEVNTTLQRFMFDFRCLIQSMLAAENLLKQ